MNPCDNAAIPASRAEPGNGRLGTSAAPALSAIASEHPSSANTFVRLVLDALASDDTDAGVRAVIQVLVEHGHADWAGVTTLAPEGGGFVTAAHTHDLVRILDALQYRALDGPTLHAATTREVVIANNLRGDGRWSSWARRAEMAGVSAVLSVPLHHGRTPLGAVNLYRQENHQYSRGDLEVARLAAAHIAVLLRHNGITYQLASAIDDRTVIGQAQGMLMEHFHLTADQAFAALRRCSQDSNTKLSVIAGKLVETRWLPGTLPAPRGHVPLSVEAVTNG